MVTNEIYRVVKEDMLGVAMCLLRKEVDGMPYELQSRLENAEMLVRQYYSYADKAMEDNVRNTVLELVDDIVESQNEKSAIRYEYSVRRNWHIRDETLAAALCADYDSSDGVTIELDAQLIVLFRQVWLSGRLDASSIQMLRTFVLSDGNLFARRLTVSAMMLRCIRYYDRRLVAILMECRLAEAHVAVVMIAMACEKRIDCDKVSLDMFADYLADSVNAERCAVVYGNVMRTFETQNIASEMRDKIIPIVREQGMKFREDAGMRDLFGENGLNPEWEERLDKSGVIDKMRRINDMQFEGADIHYESFQQMKSGAFFMEMAHWFFPFDMKYHLLSGMEESGVAGVGEFSGILNLCDSDRYSLFLMLKGMGVAGLGDALKNLGVGNYDEVREQLENVEKWKKTRRDDFETEVRFVVMNLFRFYTQAPNHSDIISPFARIMPSGGSVLGYYIVPAGIRYGIASALFRYRQWELAHCYYQTVVDSYVSDDAMIYQKMGYCSEKMEQWSVAVDEYGKSDIILPDDVWTFRHMAICYRHMEDDDMAAIMYRKVLELDKESIEAIDNLADIYMTAEDYPDAKPLLYKLDYVRGSYSDLRRLGHCLFMMGERAESVQYFDKACFDHENSTDLDCLKHAIAVGNNELLLGECFKCERKPERAMELMRNTEVESMLSLLTTEEQNKIRTIINKLILEQ